MVKADIKIWLPFHIADSTYSPTLGKVMVGTYSFPPAISGLRWTKIQLRPIQLSAMF